MEDFILLFRKTEIKDGYISESEKQKAYKKWANWFGGIEAQGKINNMGIRLNSLGAVLKPGGVITDGPFVEIKERLNGFIVIKAENLEDAITLAHGCPILDDQGSVEIRPFKLSDQKQFDLLTGNSIVDR